MLFERLNVEDRAPSGLDAACAVFADWLSEAQDCFEDEEIELLAWQARILKE